MFPYYYFIILIYFNLLLIIIYLWIFRFLIAQLIFYKISEVCLFFNLAWIYITILTEFIHVFLFYSKIIIYSIQHLLILNLRVSLLSEQTSLDFDLNFIFINYLLFFSKNFPVSYELNLFNSTNSNRLSQNKYIDRYNCHSKAHESCRRQILNVQVLIETDRHN